MPPVKKNPRYYESFPDVHLVVHNKGTTVVILKNGGKGITKKFSGVKCDHEKAFWIAYAKALRSTLKFAAKILNDGSFIPSGIPSKG